MGQLFRGYCYMLINESPGFMTLMCQNERTKWIKWNEPWWCLNKVRHRINLGFYGGSDGKESTCNVRDPDLFPGLGRHLPQVWSLEKKMATHPSILIFWRIPWTEEPGVLQPTGSQRVQHTWVTNASYGTRIDLKFFQSPWIDKLHLLQRLTCATLSSIISLISH